MQFTSIRFLILLSVAALGCRMFQGRGRYLWLFGMNVCFYVSWKPLYGLFLAFSILITWGCGIVMERQDKKRSLLCLCLLLNLSILFFFKYTRFAMTNLERLSRWLGGSYKGPGFDLLLPLGISFYTFQSLGYVIDVFRGTVPAERNLLKYALFVSFFPQICAGPIGRAGDLMPQIERNKEPDWEDVRVGFAHMLWGYFMKMVLADRIAMGVNQVYGHYGDYGTFALAMTTMLFGVQIYCDFAGYSEIAVGAARVMGYRLKGNFSQPYFAENTVDFWRKWHISLSTWFRDYVYIPLGGNRCGKWKQYRNIMVVFIVSGLWHGAGWKYVIWGALHGGYQIVGISTKKLRDKWKKRLEINTECFSYHLFQKAVTFCLVDFAWIFFQAPGGRAALGIIKRILLPSYWFEGTLNVGLNGKNLAVVMAGTLVVLAVDYLRSKGGALEKFQRQNVIFRYGIYYLGIMAVMIFGIYGPGYDPSQFIYSQF